MKKILILISLLALTLLVGCNNMTTAGVTTTEGEKMTTTTYPQWEDPYKKKKEYDVVELLEDTKFKTGINMLGTNPGYNQRQTFGKLDYFGTALTAEQEPLWVSAQWYSKYNLANELKKEDGLATATKDGDTYTYGDPAKTIAVNPETGQISLTVRTSVDYGNTPRVPDQGWSHLLLEQTFPHLKKLEELDEVRVNMDYEITQCDLMMDETKYNPLIHAAQLVWFITLTNTSNEYGTTSDYLWFSIALWDNRGIQKYGQTTIDKGTAHYMSGPSPYIYLNPFRDRSQYDTDKFYIPLNTRVSFELNILPYLKEAFYNVQAAGGLVGCKLENMAVNYMNMGWEIPGTFDVSATIYDMGIDGIIYK